MPALLLRLLPACLVVLAATPGGAKTREQQLLSLSIEARLEQRCNGRASGLVRREHPGFTPDEVVAYAFAEVALHGSDVEAPGAALRSKGHWYRLSYHCVATPDGLGIEDFSYRLGEVVPVRDWEAHYLVP